MRIIKEADERQNEILDAASELFGQKGFDGTSTNNIMEKVGIARGTLYYHFKSKEEILNALIERYNIRLISAAQKIVENTDLPINERIIRVIVALNISQGNGKEVIKKMHKPQNALMHQKAQKAILNGITPILSEVIKEGIKQGLFNTPFPRECMEMVITYANTVFDNDMEMTDEERSERIKAFTFNIERLLGVESGSLVPYVMKMFNSRNESEHE